MKPNLLRTHTGLLLAAAACWIVIGALGLGLGLGLPGAAQAQGTPATPAAADASAATGDGQQGDAADTAAQAPATGADGEPAAAAAQAADDTTGTTDTDTADDTGTGTAQPMDDAAQATDAAGTAQPADDTTDTADDTGTAQPTDAAGTAQPMDDAAQATDNAAAAPGAMSGSGATPVSSSSMSGMGGDIAWGRDYRTWQQTTGYVNSAAHGNRLLVTYVTPPDAARVYRGNAALVRNNMQGGFQPFPPGTQIAAESFRKGSQGKPGPRGPLFLMKKEAAGGGWQYAFAAPDFRLLGEGTAGRVAFCQACHETAAARDAVFAVDR